MTQAAVETHELTRRFGSVTAVEKLTLRIATGEELASGAYGNLYLPSQWLSLSKALADPDASALATSSQFASDTYGAYRSIGCQDSMWKAFVLP